VIDSYSFVVLGKPITQGSKRYVGNGRMIDPPALQPWRDAISWHARRARPDDWPTDVAYTVHATFSFQRPMSRKEGSRHVIAPDLDKLVRAVLDAMTGITYRDDGQVDRIVARKTYGEPGALIAIESWPV
jgi:crossover junction endodeoxyribonuclease RusA